jgi:hypothetical protein
MGETTASFLFWNIKIWIVINRGMAKITKVTRIADLITPFNYFHKVFEILLLILSLGTTWRRFMPPYGTSVAENLSGPRTFSLDLLEGCQYAESTQFVLSHVAGAPLAQGNAYSMRYFHLSSSASAWHSYLAHSVVSRVIFKRQRCANAQMPSVALVSPGRFPCCCVLNHT